MLKIEYDIKMYTNLTLLYILPMIKEKPVYKIKDIILARSEAAPYWPAKIIQICAMRGYRVVFFGEKVAAFVKEKDVLPYTQVNLRNLLRNKQNKANEYLNSAIDLASEVVRQRKLGSIQFFQEENYYEYPIDFQQNEELLSPEPEKQNQSLESSQPQKPLFIQLKLLLNQLSEQAANNQQWKTPISHWNLKKEERLLEIMDPNFQLQLVGVSKFKVIQNFIVNIKEILYWRNQWKEKEQLFAKIIMKYEQLKTQILSKEIHNYEIQQPRKKALIEKVKTFKAVLLTE